MNLHPGPVSVGNESLSLDEFKANQAKQRAFLAQRIIDASQASRDRFKKGINTVLDDLRMRINEFSQDDDPLEDDMSHKPGRVDGAAKERRGMNQDPVFEQLGFKSNLKYGPRSKLRQACTRFLRFSYLLDFIALEGLSNIFLESVKDTILKLRELSAVKPDFEFKQVVKNALGEIVNQPGPSGLGAAKKTDYTQIPDPAPLFRISAHFHPVATKSSVNPGSEGIPLKSYLQIKVPPFEPGLSKPQDFDPLVHIEIGEEKPEDNSESPVPEEEEFDSGEESRMLERVKIEGLNEHWLTVEP